MADNDQSLYNIRYNQITQGMEGFGGGTPMWTPLLLSADGGVTSVNALTGAVVLAAGNNITLTPSGNTITIASSGGSSLSSPVYLETATNTVTSSTDYVDTHVTNTFALSNAANNVKISACGSVEQDTGGVFSLFTVSIDGTPIRDAFALVAGDSHISMIVLAHPGDTASHTYTVQAKNSDGSGVLTFPDGPFATMLIEEILA